MEQSGFMRIAGGGASRTFNTNECIRDRICPDMPAVIICRVDGVGSLHAPLNGLGQESRHSKCRANSVGTLFFSEGKFSGTNREPPPSRTLTDSGDHRRSFPGRSNPNHPFLTHYFFPVVSKRRSLVGGSHASRWRSCHHGGGRFFILQGTHFLLAHFGNCPRHRRIVPVAGAGRKIIGRPTVAGEKG